MKWVQNNKTKIYNFWTLQDEQLLADLKYGIDAHTVRFTYSRHRLFFLEPGGLFQNKLLIQSEYGLTIGENYFSNKNSRDGNLYVQQMKFQYTTEEDTVILMNKKSQMLADCAISKMNELDEFEFTALLFSLTWFCLDDLHHSKKDQKAVTL